MTEDVFCEDDSFPILTRFERVLFLDPVHIVREGQSLCSMSKWHGVPAKWPFPHSWVLLSDSENATCKACQSRAAKLL